MKIWVPVVLTASLFASGSGTPRAQTQVATSHATSSAKPDYSRESFVFEQLTRVYRYAADGTGSREITGVIDIQNQAAVKALSVIPFDFASSSEHVEIDYVRVRRPDGTVIPTPASDVQELPTEVTREAPFYSDLKQEQIPIRSLREGDHLEYKVRIVRTKPEAPGHFWGSESLFTPSSGFVVLSEVVELHVPKTAYVQVWSPKYKPTLTQTTDESVYHWQNAQLEPVAGKEKNALLLMDKNPTLGTNDDPKLPSIAWTNFHSWTEVGSWYRGLEGARTQPDDDTRAKVTTLIAGKTTPEEKAQAIYNFVGAQVRYIGVAFGVGRYQPHEAGEVLQNQYGDCKDKATLLTSMLSAAGITADTVLIGAGITFNEAVPSPGSFNHAITLAHVDGKPIWLDATAEVAPYQLLNPIIRDKQALVIPLVGDAQIETTPKEPPFPSEIHFEATGTLDDQGTSHSHMVMDLRGDAETIYRQAVRTVSPAQWDQLMQNISQAMSFAGKVTNTSFSRPDDTSAPFHLSYDYESEKAGDWDNLRIVPQLSVLGLADIDEKNPPVTPIDIGVPHIEVDHVVMKLPKNWVADLPPAIHAKSTFATLDKTYKFENGTLTTDRRVEVLVEKIPAANWRAYHQWFKDASLDSETYIQLNNTPFPGGDTVHQPLSSGEDNAIAADLIRQATQAEQKRDWATAKATLDAARNANPKQAYLWSNYGYLAMQDGDLNDAIADYKKELAANPEESYVTRLLAGALMRQQKPEEAIAVMQSAVDHNPSDEPTVLSLASILAGRGDNPSAEKVLRTGLASKPDSLNLKMRLGITLLHEQKNDEGEALIRDVLAKSDNPEQLNDAAYSIADASLDLPLAEKSSRRSLELLDETTNNGETGPKALGRANLLAHAWDTLGWILFREDKVAEAELWVRAAWRNGNAAETGYYLASILEKENHPAEALAQIDLAAIGEPGTDAASVKKLIADKQEELLKSGNASHLKDAKLELQNQRTYSFPRGKVTPTGENWATVELELTAQATTAVRIVQGDQSLQPLTDTIQHLNLDLKIPPDSHAKLIRRGVLSCHTSSTNCQLVLISTRSALNP
jgi:tetratricopeptide (TPR) repeat protein/transglutaminase-like putative cysteine protease